jgi:hypothetical protein
VNNARTRIYLVDTNDDRESRLIRAQNKAAALRYAARTSLTVCLATQDDIINALSRQIPIEEVGADEVEQE